MAFKLIVKSTSGGSIEGIEQEIHKYQRRSIVVDVYIRPGSITGVDLVFIIPVRAIPVRTGKYDILGRGLYSDDSLRQDLQAWSGYGY